MQFRHVIGYETSKTTGAIVNEVLRDKRIIAIINNLTDYDETVISDTLWTIHNNDKNAKILDNKRIILLIPILREPENNITSIKAITLHRKDRNPLNTVNFEIPLKHELIKSLPRILRNFFRGINVHEGLSEVSDRILIVKCCDKANPCRLRLVLRYRRLNYNILWFTIP